MVGATFCRKKVTTQISKFDYVVSPLPPSAASLIRDVIRTPPDEESCDTLQVTLIRRTAVSEQRKLCQLVTYEELGNRKTTELLRCKLQASPARRQG